MGKAICPYRKIIIANRVFRFHIQVDRTIIKGNPDVIRQKMTTHTVCKCVFAFKSGKGEQRVPAPDFRVSHIKSSPFKCFRPIYAVMEEFIRIVFHKENIA